MNKQVNVRLSEYDLGLINALKKHYDTNSSTEIIKRCLEYTALYCCGIPVELIYQKAD